MHKKQVLKVQRKIWKEKLHLGDQSMWLTSIVLTFRRECSWGHLYQKDTWFYFIKLGFFSDGDRSKYV